MISEERKKQLKKERAICNKEIKKLAQERNYIGDIQRKHRVRTWRIGEILRGEIEDE